MLSELINPPNSSKNSNNSNSKMPEKGENNPQKGGFNDLANAIPANPARDEMPTRPELEAICRRAVIDFPNVDVNRLRRFLEVADDPAWCSERAARRLAERMVGGLIR